MRLPSIKTIEKSFPYLGKEDAKKIRKILETYCYSPRKCLSKIDKILETHGVEYIEDMRYRDKYNTEVGVLYCNAGDGCATTILYDYDKGNYYISCWGDIVQRYPKRFGY